MKYCLYAFCLGLLMCFSSVTLAQESITEQAISEDDLHHAGIIRIQAKKTVTGNKKISGNSQVTYKAGEAVVLKPGFEVKEGSIFQASVDHKKVITKTVSHESEGFMNPHLKNQAYLNIYPNPNQGNFKIEVNAKEIEKAHGQSEYRMVIYNTRGEIVADQSGNSNQQYDFNFDLLSKGVYYLRLMNNAEKSQGVRVQDLTQIEFKQIIIE